MGHCKPEAHTKQGFLVYYACCQPPTKTFLRNRFIKGFVRGFPDRVSGIQSVLKNIYKFDSISQQKGTLNTCQGIMNRITQFDTIITWICLINLSNLEKQSSPEEESYMIEPGGFSP